MEQNVRAAERAFDFLTKRHQPNQGGTDEGLQRLKDAYDRAMAAFGTAPGRILWESDAGRAGRQRTQARASSVHCAGRICDANAITWRPCDTAVSVPICPPPTG
jgi:hypothetical protein